MCAQLNLLVIQWNLRINDKLVHGPLSTIRYWGDKLVHGPLSTIRYWGVFVKKPVVSIELYSLHITMVSLGAAVATMCPWLQMLI